MYFFSYLELWILKELHRYINVILEKKTTVISKPS